MVSINIVNFTKDRKEIFDDKVIAVFDVEYSGEIGINYIRIMFNKGK